MKFKTIVSTLILSFSLNSHANLPKPIGSHVAQLENALSAHIGLSVLFTETGDFWHYKGDDRVPMMSTFKTLLCAKLLKDAEDKRLSLNDNKTISKDKIVTYSPVIESLSNQTVSLKDACKATMLTSDNTAANIVLESIGGPSALTQFVRNYGDKVTQLDRYETALNEGIPKDIRDTTTPNAMSRLLNTLLFGNVLSHNSEQQLLQWMKDNQVTGTLLRTVLPDGWQIADRSGVGGHGSRGIAAIVWSEESKPIIISIYIADSKLTMAERDSVIVSVGHELFKVLGRVDA